ncbi:MAG: hypothetical protein EPO26_13645 [Chloroflexota bacterium]|nr:MAG: hypothetical protein EPO26_13645 [Chloroflexota bacterium]
MTATTRQQTWDLWFPEAGATGLPFARGRVNQVDVMWVHAAPETLAVIVRDGDERVVARNDSLKRTGRQYPLTRLAIRGWAVVREDRRPTEADLSALVMLPGGEVGVLQAWWNAPDGSEWRWQVEFYNRK